MEQLPHNKPLVYKNCTKNSSALKLWRSFFFIVVLFPTAALNFAPNSCEVAANGVKDA